MLWRFLRPVHAGSAQIRWVNHYVYTIATDNTDFLLQSEMVKKKIYLQNHTLFAVIMFLSSLALLGLLVYQLSLK